MSLASRPHAEHKNGGFTLVELGVVVVIIGLLTAFAVPRFMNSVERSKAAEAYNYLAMVRSAQERYHAREGRYADAVAKLDTELPAPAYFSVGTIAIPSAASSLGTGWELTLTRSGPSAGYGAYEVRFNEAGFDKLHSTIPDAINPFRAL